MKKLILGLLTLILGLAGVNVFKRLTEDSEKKVKFYVYNKRTGTLFNEIFRIIPTMHDTMIDVETVEPFSKELNLYRVNVDIYGGQPDIHYIVYDKDNRELSELKSDYLAMEIQTFSYDTILSSLIDTEVFRQVFEPRLKTHEQIADKYAELLASSLDSANFKRVHDDSDITTIQSSHKRTQSPMIDEEKTIKDFSFLNNLPENEFVYWFYDLGLVKITVDMKEGQLVKVGTLIVGNLGVEITHL